MSEPPGVSLSLLGLVAPDGLACPLGGSHHVLEAALRRAAATEDGGEPICQKCHQRVRLVPARELA